MDKGEGVKNSENFADVLYDWSLAAFEAAANAAMVAERRRSLLRRWKSWR